MRKRRSPRSSLNRRSSMGVSPEPARILSPQESNPQSHTNVTGIGPLPHCRLLPTPRRPLFAVTEGQFELANRGRADPRNGYRFVPLTAGCWELGVVWDSIAVGSDGSSM